MKTNPSKKGYYCHVYSIGEYTHIRETFMKCVIAAHSKEEARAILEKAVNYDPKTDPEYKYTLDEVIIYT